MQGLRRVLTAPSTPILGSVLNTIIVIIGLITMGTHS
jgi:hypothetical protein